MSESKQSCLTQYFKTHQEIRCKDCYDPQHKILFDAEKSFKDLSKNLPKLKLELKRTSFQSPEYEKLFEKIKEVERRIIKVEEILKKGGYKK